MMRVLPAVFLALCMALPASADFCCVYTMTTNDCMSAWRTGTIPVDEPTARTVCDEFYANYLHRSVAGGVSGRHIVLSSREIVTNAVSGPVVCGWFILVREDYDKAYDAALAIAAGQPFPALYGRFTHDNEGSPDFVYEALAVPTVRRVASSLFAFSEDAAWSLFSSAIRDQAYRTGKLATLNGEIRTFQGRKEGN